MRDDGVVAEAAAPIQHRKLVSPGGGTCEHVSEGEHKVIGRRVLGFDLCGLVVHPERIGALNRPEELRPLASLSLDDAGMLSTRAPDVVRSPTLRDMLPFGRRLHGGGGASPRLRQIMRRRRLPKRLGGGG